MKGIMKRIVSIGGIGLITALSSQANAAGYKVEFQSVSTLADAGDAAVVEDAGTNWYNSAGIVLLPQQVVYALMDVYAPTTFSGDVSAPTTLPPPLTPFGSSFAASGHVTSHPNSVLPAIHYTMPIQDRFAFAFSIVPAWGFTEDYGRTSIVRYDLTRVYTKTLDIAPSVAMKITNQWSFGFGPDFHYFSVQSRNNVRTQGLSPFGSPADSTARFSASRWGYGGHAGILFRYDDATRIGLNYRTNIYMNLDGFSSFGLNGFGFFESNAFKLAIPLPPTTSLSVYRDINPRWALMGTLAYDQWSVLQDYHARNIITPPSPSNPSGVLTDVVLPQHYHNTIDVSVGTHFKLTDKLMLRGSVKYEPTPTISAFRDINFPDAPKLGFQIGSRYTLNPTVAFDLIYGHVFTRTVGINNVNPITGASISGHNNTSIDLVGAQLVWNI